MAVQGIGQLQLLSREETVVALAVGLDLKKCQTSAQTVLALPWLSGRGGRAGRGKPGSLGGGA